MKENMHSSTLEMEVQIDIMTWTLSKCFKDGHTP